MGVSVGAGVGVGVGVGFGVAVGTRVGIAVEVGVGSAGETGGVSGVGEATSTLHPPVPASRMVKHNTSGSDLCIL